MDYSLSIFVRPSSADAVQAMARGLGVELTGPKECSRMSVKSKPDSVCFKANQVSEEMADKVEVEIRNLQRQDPTTSLLKYELNAG